MKSIFFALFFVVFTYAQVITFTNDFAPTYEGKTTTSLIRVTNNGKFFKSGKNNIQSIKFRISVESTKPSSASAVFNPLDEKFFGAIAGEADGFFYFNVSGLSGTYQCLLHAKYVDWKGNKVTITPYKFAFTIQKNKKARDVAGRIRPNEEEVQLVPVYEEGRMIESVAEEGRDIESRQTGYNPNCPTPATYDAIWQGCDLVSVLPQTTANSVSFKNQLPAGTGSYPVMANVTYTFTGVSSSTNVWVTQAPTTIFKQAIASVYLNIQSNGGCTTYFTFNVKYYKASGGSVQSLVINTTTQYSWSTTFNPVDTYPAQGFTCS